VQNAVPDGATITEPVEHSVAARTLRNRADTYAEEVRRLLDAAYAVMRRTGTLDPRVSDIVSEAGLSNQAFYRHFRGKDELLLAVLDDGQRRLVSYLDARMARAEPGTPRVRAWVDGVLEQARNPAAAENTRPFVNNNVRVADRFELEHARSRELLVAQLRAAVVEAGGDPRDADVIYQLAMGRMQDALVRHERPSADEVEHLVEFAVRGLTLTGAARAPASEPDSKPGYPGPQRGSATS
jgi:AcrR family transcriptional regulator